MKKGIIYVVVIVLVLIVVFFVLEKKKAVSPNENQNIGMTAQNEKSGASSAELSTNSISIKNFSYSPKSLTVKKGTTVTWTNEDTAKHTVTSDTGGVLNSELFGKGEKYSFKFDQVGKFDYYCAPHPNMKGSVTVVE